MSERQMGRALTGYKTHNGVRHFVFEQSHNGFCLEVTVSFVEGDDIISDFERLDRYSASFSCDEGASGETFVWNNKLDG